MKINVGGDDDNILNTIDDLIKKKNVSKLVMDKLGNHCIAVADHELFYMNWYDTRV